MKSFTKIRASGAFKDPATTRKGARPTAWIARRSGVQAARLALSRKSKGLFFGPIIVHSAAIRAVAGENSGVAPERTLQMLKPKLLFRNPNARIDRNAGIVLHSVPH